MTNQEFYRVLMPDGTLSHDSFRVFSEQPKGIPSKCVVAVNDRDHSQILVHRARLLPIALGEPKKACPLCGRVLDVVQEGVKCPYDESDPSGLSGPPDGLEAALLCAEHSLHQPAPA
jgi:hypothetical protein